MTPSLSVSMARKRICSRSRFSRFCPFARPLPFPLPCANAAVGTTAALRTMAAKIPGLFIDRLRFRLLERLAGVGRAAVESAAQPRRPLLRRAVGELVREHVTGRHSLDP